MRDEARPAGYAALQVPEGHSIHRIAREHTRLLAGRTISASSPQGRFSEGANAVDGTRLQKVEPYGKHLFYRFEFAPLVHVHLGTRGRFADYPAPPFPDPRPQVRVRMVAETAATDLIAPIICEVLDERSRDQILARLGPDPLRPDADPKQVWEALRGNPASLGALLLDQSIVAGIGNVLRAEILFLEGIHPSTPAASLNHADFDRLWTRTLEVMGRATDEGRIITARPTGVAVDDLPEAEGRWVYKQDRCRRCGTPVDVWELGGRIAYACPVCQPQPEAAVAGARRRSRGPTARR